MKAHRLKLSVMTAGVMFLLVGCSVAPSGQTPDATEAQSSDTAMAATIAYIDSGLPDLAGKTIAYLAECGPENAYCQVRLSAAEEAAADLGASMTLFNAGFDPAKQLQQTQDAIQRGFDGYILSPVADAAGCANFKLLQATGKPVVNINSPMCGSTDFTEGTAGFVASQTTSYYLAHLSNAFSSCTEKCKAVLVGGYVGSDLNGRWQAAILEAAAKYPNVEIVSNQPGDYDPATALAVVQDAITTNPDLALVVSSWDEMTQGVEKAVTGAGKTPNKDVRIYSIGATIAGVEKVASGIWTSTTILLPFEESYYGFVQLAKAMATGEITPGFTNLSDSPVVLDGPGSVFISSANVNKYAPRF